MSSKKVYSSWYAFSVIFIVFSPLLILPPRWAYDKVKCIVCPSSHEIQSLISSTNDKLVNNDNSYYKNQLRPQTKDDPYCTNSLFDIYEKVKKTV